MAVTLTGSNGLFTRLGKIFYVAEQVKALQATLATEVEDVIDEYSSTDVYMLNGNLDIRALQIAAGNSLLPLQRMTQQTIIEMVDADAKLPVKSLDAALTELIDQMETGSDSINGYDSDASETVTNPSGDDKGQLLYSFVDGEGVTLQHVRAETLTVKAKTDAQLGGVTSGLEVFTVSGPSDVTDIRDPDWGTGSGVNRTIRVASAVQDGGKSPNQNVLTNSDFDVFTVSNVADNWTYDVGAAGTDILEEGTTKFRGDKSLALVGDGATLHSISQTLNTAGQTTGRLRPQRRYALGFRIRLSGLTTGFIRASVKDGSGTILDSGNAAVSQDLSLTSSTKFDLDWATFSTPADIPDTVKFVLEATTAISNTDTVYLDEVVLVELVQVTAGGPFIAIVPGSADFVVDDSDSEFTLAYGADISSSAKFVYWMDRFLGLRNRPKTLPVDLSGSETIADSLVA